MQHESEGEEQRRKEAAALERKRKAEEKETWENGREERVAGWRTFAKNGAKKKVSLSSSSSRCLLPKVAGG
jgi:DnaJ family protein C protein 8